MSESPSTAGTGQASNGKSKASNALDDRGGLTFVTTTHPDQVRGFRRQIRSAAIRDHLEKRNGPRKPRGPSRRVLRNPKPSKSLKAPPLAPEFTLSRTSRMPLGPVPHPKPFPKLVPAKPRVIENDDESHEALKSPDKFTLNRFMVPTQLLKALSTDGPIPWSTEWPELADYCGLPDHFHILLLTQISRLPPLSRFYGTPTVRSCQALPIRIWYSSLT